MKKRYYFLFSLLMLSLLTASCGDKKKLFKEDKNTNTDSDSQTVVNIAPPPIIRISSGDVLSITIEPIMKTTEIPFVGTQEVVVKQDGSFTIPKLGDFMAKGKTSEELTIEVKEKASLLLEKPEVVVNLKYYKIQILGEVSRPGILDVPGGESITIIQAIGLAGNITSESDARHIKLIRRDGTKLVSHTLDLTSLDIFNSPVLYIQSGDVIYVPKSNSFSLIKGTAIINSIAIILNTILLLSRI